VRFPPETVAILRRDLMKRGSVLATRLSDVLAGKRPPDVMSIINAKPGLRPEEALRLALAQIESRRTLLDAGDDHYGRCDVCGDEIPIAALHEMPWADRCQRHAST
jgi:RNA polymerase-binding transcription factor DksA